MAERQSRSNPKANNKPHKVLDSRTKQVGESTMKCQKCKNEEATCWFGTKRLCQKCFQYYRLSFLTFKRKINNKIRKGGIY